MALSAETPRTSGPEHHPHTASTKEKVLVTKYQQTESLAQGTETAEVKERAFNAEGAVEAEGSFKTKEGAQGAGGAVEAKEDPHKANEGSLEEPEGLVEHASSAGRGRALLSLSVVHRDTGDFQGVWPSSIQGQGYLGLEGWGSSLNLLTKSTSAEHCSRSHPVPGAARFPRKLSKELGQSSSREQSGGVPSASVPTGGHLPCHVSVSKSSSGSHAKVPGALAPMMLSKSVSAEQHVSLQVAQRADALRQQLALPMGLAVSKSSSNDNHSSIPTPSRRSLTTAVLCDAGGLPSVYRGAPSKLRLQLSTRQLAVLSILLLLISLALILHSSFLHRQAADVIDLQMASAVPVKN